MRLISSFWLLLSGLTYTMAPIYNYLCRYPWKAGSAKPGLRLTERPIRRSVLVDIEIVRVENLVVTQNVRYLKLKGGEHSILFLNVLNTTKSGYFGYSYLKVYPLKSNLYLNKIQCFCFDSLRLHSYESLDLPVFFGLDLSLILDPLMSDVFFVLFVYYFF